MTWENKYFILNYKRRILHIAWLIHVQYTVGYFYFYAEYVHKTLMTALQYIIHLDQRVTKGVIIIEKERNKERKKLGT